MNTGTMRNEPCSFRKLLRLLAFALLLAGATTGARAADFVFGGAAVSGCSLAGNVYSCAAFPLTGSTDTMTIADGFSVNVATSITFGFNQVLRTSGTARLSSAGDLNLAGIARANLQLSGGDLVAGGTLRVGNLEQTFNANLTGGRLDLGSAKVIINGSLTSSSTIAIAAHAQINGAVTSSGAITLGPHAVIKGAVSSSGTIALGSHAAIIGPISATDVDAQPHARLTGEVSVRNLLQLGSGAAVNGNVTAAVVDLLPSNVVVTGNVSATQSVTLGSGTEIRGDVSTSLLTLRNANAKVTGNAIVDKAVLGRRGRVTKFITCRSGATAGDCGCVENNSGYAFNSIQGPKCVAPAAASGAHHFLVVHPASGASCGAPVTVYACANSACTAPHYSGGATVALEPGGDSVEIGSSGIATALVSTDKPADIINVEPDGANPSTCRNADTGSTDCAISFTQSAFQVTPVDAGGNPLRVLTAAAPYALRIRAVTSPGSEQACVPAFGDVDKDLDLHCAYGVPDTGSLPVRLNGSALNRDNAVDSACDADGAAMRLRFNASGIATTSLMYPDAGRVSVSVALPEQAMSGSTSFVSVPASFAFSGVPASGAAGRNLRAGSRLAALNADGAATRNFGLDAGGVALSMLKCRGKGDGAFDGAVGGFGNGEADIANIEWSEAGTIRLRAALTSYLGETVNVRSESASGCSGAGVIDVFPDHFDVLQQAVRPYYYSGQPIEVNVIAKNAHNAVTTNYDGVTATVADRIARPVTVRVFAENTMNENPGAGTASANSVPAAAFISGTAALQQPVYTLPALPPGAPVRVWLGGSSDQVALTVNDGDNQRYWIRTGRLRLSNRFGFAGAPLRLPVVAEYWTGRSWLVNADDNFTAIPATAVVGPAGITVAAGVTLAAGRANLVLGRAGRGSADIALNLGTSAAHQSCAALAVASSGANLAYLRSLYGCAATADRDPSARAGFGVFPPETRRIIHVRESFK